MDQNPRKNSTGSTESDSDPTPDQILKQLDRVCQSAEFSASARLREFLTYVVNETFAGRGDKIRGKTIAMDVYDRTAEFAGDQENVVRVDAGRLRRKLNEYYTETGKDDPVRIHVDPGGYSPRFEAVGTASESGLASAGPGVSGSRRIWIAAFLAAAVAVPLAYWQATKPAGNDETDAGSRKRIERQAVLEKSPTALQALNLSEQARDMIFPAVDAERIAAARTMFEQATTLDPDYFGGFAGLAQTVATQARLRPPGEERDTLLAEAAQHAETAVRLSPAEGWSQSAKAWVAFHRRDFQAANDLSKRAVKLAPEDLHVLEFDSLIALFSGDFERVLETSDPERHKDRLHDRFVFLSAFASANFHTGNYRRAADLFNANVAKGGMVSPITFAYLAAANQKDRRYDDATRLAEQLRESWPGIRIDLLLMQLFRDPAHVRQIIEPLKQAGWTPAQQ